MSKHTPGPWRLSYLGDTQGPVIQRGDEGGFVVLGRSVEQQDADARLIAAAPELLAALKLCRFDSLNMTLADWAKVQDAIVKAEGGKA